MNKNAITYHLVQNILILQIPNFVGCKCVELRNKGLNLKNLTFDKFVCMKIIISIIMTLVHRF